MVYEQNFIIQVWKNAENSQGVFRQKTYPFQAPIEDTLGWPMPTFGEHIKKVATPQTYPRTKGPGVPAYPSFIPGNSPVNQQQGGTRFFDCLENIRLIGVPKTAGTTSHNPETREGPL